MGDFSPLGRDKDLALRGLSAPWGGSDKDLAHGDFSPLGRLPSSLMGDSPQGRTVWDLTHWGTQPSGEAHCQSRLA